MLFLIFISNFFNSFYILCIKIILSNYLVYNKIKTKYKSFIIFILLWKIHFFLFFLRLWTFIILLIIFRRTLALNIILIVSLYNNINTILIASVYIYSEIFYVFFVYIYSDILYFMNISGLLRSFTLVIIFILILRRKLTITWS